MCVCVCVCVCVCFVIWAELYSRLFFYFERQERKSFLFLIILD